MIAIREAGEVTKWMVAFYSLRPASIRWARFVPGKYKHVSVFGFCTAARTWVYFDAGMAGIYLRLLPDTEQSQRGLAALTTEADVLVFDARPIEWEKIRVRPSSCTSFALGLLGLNGGALLPDGLWRLLVREGAKSIDGTIPRPSP